MNLRLALGSLSALVFACSSQPPPIGTTDASADTSSPGDASAADAPTGDSASKTDASGEAGTCTLTSPPADSTCAACVEATCCASWNACVGNSDCTGYVACARACAAADGGVVASDAGDQGDCYSGCQKKYPNGINDGIVVVDCETNGCVGKCP